MTPDRTIAIDAAMRNALSHCTGCGNPFTSAWFNLWTRSDGLVLPVAACPSCKRQDPTGAALSAKLAVRYGA